MLFQTNEALPNESVQITKPDQPISLITETPVLGVLAEPTMRLEFSLLKVYFGNSRIFI